MSTNIAMVWKAQEALVPHAHPAEGVQFRALITQTDLRTRGRLLEVFTVNVRNPSTRAAYGRAARRWRSDCGKCW